MGDEDEKAITPKPGQPQSEKKPDQPGQQPDKPIEKDGPSKSSGTGPHHIESTDPETQRQIDEAARRKELDERKRT